MQANAAITLYTNEAAYLAAVGATRTFIDFAGSPGVTVSGGTFSPDVFFGTCLDSSNLGTCAPIVVHNSDAITDIGGSAAANGVASLVWGFNIPARAFAFHYISGQVNAVNLVDPSLAFTSVDTSSATGFIGLVTDTDILGGIGVNAVFPNGIGNDRYFIDDFRINGTIPEPATLSLAGLALAGVLWGRRRRS